MARPRIVVVGSINVDLVVRAARLPGRGETVAGGEFTRSGGGKGANQAVAAARAGGAVALAGAVGDDDFGADALAELRADGVDVSAVARLGDTPTGVALIVVDRDGANQIAVASGANHAFGAGATHAALDALGGSPDCVLASFELREGPVLAAGRYARAAGRPFVVNPAPARALSGALCELRPVVTPNEQEAAELAGVDDPAAGARALAGRTAAPVIVTLGARGALLVDGASVLEVPAPRVDVVDTTGAGDAFNGVLAVELGRGAGLRDAVGAAVEAASLSVMVAGARGG